MPSSGLCFMPPAALCAQNCAKIRGRTVIIERHLRPCIARPISWAGNKQGSSDKLRNFVRAASSHQEPYKASDPLPSTRPAPACPSGYSIRRATPDDVGQVGELNAEVRHKAFVLIEMLKWGLHQLIPVQTRALLVVTSSCL